MSQGSELVETSSNPNENKACKTQADSVKVPEELIRRLMNEALSVRRMIIKALKEQDRLIDELKTEQLKY